MVGRHASSNVTGAPGRVVVAPVVGAPAAPESAVDATAEV